MLILIIISLRKLKLLPDYNYYWVAQAFALLHVVRRQGEIYFLIPKRTYAVHQRSKHDTAIIIFFLIFGYYF